MKIIYILVFIAIYAQADFSSLLNSVVNTTQKSGILSSSKTLSAITSNDKIQALKDALAQGSKYAINALSKNNGFLKNPKVKIPLPPSVQKAANIISKFGGKKYVDDFDAAINHAAEKAMPEAYDIFSNTIKKMSIKDAEKLLRGGKHSATDFFKEKDSKLLYKKFYPIIKKSVEKTGVMRYYGAFKGYYDKYSPSQKSSSNSLFGSVMNIAKSTVANKYGINLSQQGINDYVTKKSIDGLFKMIATQEEKIRANPLQAASSVAKKVFSAYK